MTDRAARIAQTQILYYRGHPVEFVQQVLGFQPTFQQAEALRALVTHRHISIKSGHGTGKTALLAWVIIWAMTCFFSPKIPCTAPTAHQLEDNLWGELSKALREMKSPWRDNLKLSGDKLKNIKYPMEWFAVARTARVESPDALQGFHSRNLIFIIDEAAAIPEEVFQPVMGALTGEQNLCIMAANPTRLTGTFYDSHHKNRHLWHTLTFNAEESPLVQPEYVEQMAQTYGEKSDVYRVRVLGEFPRGAPDQLIPLDICQAAIDRETVVPGGGIIWGLDSAWYGDDATVLVKREGNIVQEITPDCVVYNYDPPQIASWAAAHYNGNWGQTKPAVIAVDTVGYGAGVYADMKQLNLPVVKVNAQGAAANPERYRNVRAETWGRMRDWLVNGFAKLPDDKFLVAELTAVKYSYVNKGAIQLEDKKLTKQFLSRSPDRADALALTFFSAASLRDRKMSPKIKKKMYNPLYGGAYA